MTEGPDLESSLDLGETPDLETSMHLIHRARDGDRAALNDLLGRYQERLRRLVRIQLGPRLRSLVESMDVVQDTYEVAFQRIGDFEPRDTASLLQWLSRIALNQIRAAHDHHFAQRRDRGREVPLRAGPDDEDSAELTDRGQTSPDDRAFKREVRAMLDEAVSRLPDQYRDVILLRDYCGAGWEHVARELGRDSAHAARQVHQRAWIRVRRMVWPRLRGGPHSQPPP